MCPVRLEEVRESLSASMIITRYINLALKHSSTNNTNMQVTLFTQRVKIMTCKLSVNPVSNNVTF